MKVLLNGVFDVLHVGHFNILMYAKVLAGGECGQVVVLIDDDSKVRMDKGHSPIFTTYERMDMLKSIKGMDGGPLVKHCFSFYNDEHLAQKIKEIKPDIMIKGSDWEGKKVIGSEYAGQLVFYPRHDAYSSSSIIERIRNPEDWKRL